MVPVQFLWWHQHCHIVLKFYGGTSLKNGHLLQRSLLTGKVNRLVIVSYNLDGDKSLNNTQISLRKQFLENEESDDAQCFNLLMITDDRL
jgi:hypothetical protein